MWRRVVPSPEPVRIVELEAITTLIAADMIVVCVGGGGVPVVVDAHGCLRGVEAVIDKDLAAAMLARELGADALLLLTDVAAIEAGWGTEAAIPIGSITVAELRRLDLAAGTIGPKAKAVSRFVAGTGAPSRDRCARAGSTSDGAGPARRRGGAVAATGRGPRGRTRARRARAAQGPYPEARQ